MDIGIFIKIVLFLLIQDSKVNFFFVTGLNISYSIKGIEILSINLSILKIINE